MKINILLVEDEPDQSNAYAQLLRTSGYNVTTCGKVREAKAMLARDRLHADLSKRFSVVVIDLSFEGYQPNPNTAGFEVLNEAILDPFLEPIIFTGKGDEVKASIASAMQVHRYVIKTSDVGGKHPSDRLLEAIKDGIEDRRNLISLSRDIENLRSTIPQLASPSISDETMTNAASSLFHAEQVFRSLLHMRGRKHRDEFPTSSSI